jgi:hypothetical protein
MSSQAWSKVRGRACSAVDLSAVAIIAELSRRFVAANDVPRWFYRGSLELLERISDQEIAAQRTLLTEIESITAATVTIIAGHGDGQNTTFPSGDPKNQTAISPIVEPERVFSIMKRAALGSNLTGTASRGLPMRL